MLPDSSRIQFLKISLNKSPTHRVMCTCSPTVTCWSIRSARTSSFTALYATVVSFLTVSRELEERKYKQHFCCKTRMAREIFHIATLSVPNSPGPTLGPDRIRLSPILSGQAEAREPGPGRPVTGRSEFLSQKEITLFSRAFHCFILPKLASISFARV